MPIYYPLLLIIVFSKLHSIHDYGTTQQVPENFCHKRAGTNFFVSKYALLKCKTQFDADSTLFI